MCNKMPKRRKKVLSETMRERDQFGVCIGRSIRVSVYIACFEA